MTPPLVGGRPVRAALLDLDDTLVDRTAAFRRWLEALMRRHPDAFAAPAQDLSTLLRLDDRGRRDRRAFYDALLDRHPALRRAGLDAEALQQDIVASLATVVAPDPAVVGAVEALRARGLALAIVTNGSSANQRAKLARSGVAHLVDAVVVSGEVGVSKPAREIYGLALEALKVVAEDALFVGDDPLRDIAGPARAGLRTCWVSHGDRWPFGPDDPELCPPDLIVAHIGELISRLG